MSTNWEKNPAYPLSFNTCRECGHQGLIKLAWDLHGHLCIDAKPCLARVSQQYTRHQQIVEEVTEEVLTSEPVSVHPTFEISETKMQDFVCERCDVVWSRPSTRGRPPKVCPDCR